MTEPSVYDLGTTTNYHVLEKYHLRKRDDYTDWAYASIEEVKENFKKIDLLNDNIVFIKGKVEETLEQEINIPHTISFLRLDTDWYESTKKELERLYDRLTLGGIIVIDDYGTFDGTRKAFNEFFQKRTLPPFLSPIDSGARIGVKVI